MLSHKYLEKKSEGCNGSNIMQAYCEDSDRPSRLESECIKGEGLQFLFPEAGCSPFPDKKECKYFKK